MGGCAVVRDRAHAGKQRGDLQSGDWLHLSDAGIRAMGNSVNLRFFRMQP